MTLRIDGKLLGILTFSMLTAACGAAPDGEPTEGAEGTVKAAEQPGQPVAPRAKPTPSAQPVLQELYGAGSTGKVVCVPKCPIQCDPEDPNCVAGSSGGLGGEQTKM